MATRKATRKATRPKSPEPETILSVRRSAGHTQTEAAEFVYVQLITWWRWESGHTEMPPAMSELYLLKLNNY